MNTPVSNIWHTMVQTDLASSVFCCMWLYVYLFKVLSLDGKNETFHCSEPKHFGLVANSAIHECFLECCFSQQVPTGNEALSYTAIICILTPVSHTTLRKCKELYCFVLYKSVFCYTWYCLMGLICEASLKWSFTSLGYSSHNCIPSTVYRVTSNQHVCTPQ